MKKSIIKKIICITAIIVCLSSFAWAVSASTTLPTTVSFSFPANNVVGYSTSKVEPGEQYIDGKITSISFIGVPTGTWVSGAHVYTALFKNTTLKSSWANFTAKNQVKEIKITGSYFEEYRFGAETTASTGASNTQYWY